MPGPSARLLAVMIASIVNWPLFAAAQTDNSANNDSSASSFTNKTITVTVGSSARGGSVHHATPPRLAERARQALTGKSQR